MKGPSPDASATYQNNPPNIYSLAYFAIGFSHMQLGSLELKDLIFG